MTKMMTKNCPKMPKKYVCEKCDFSCNKLSNYNQHLATRKHQNNDGELQKKEKMPENEKKYICECGKEYKYRQGLHTHRKRCNNSPEMTGDLKELVKKLMVENHEMKNTIINENMKLQNQNLELQKQVLDVCKSNNSINNNTINSHNKTFNLQIFLNEHCKDALNITDFANSITVQLKDLEKIGSAGYVNGISSIIIKELKGLDVTKRPVHCSDAKRETLYIKDEDKWEKECPENTKMKKIIRNVEKKNINLISEWTDKNPAHYDSTTSENEEYLNIMQQTMGGKGDYEENKNKIIKKIAKEVVIDK